jgi:hypothetical protein
VTPSSPSAKDMGPIEREFRSCVSAWAFWSRLSLADKNALTSYCRGGVYRIRRTSPLHLAARKAASELGL